MKPWDFRRGSGRHGGMGGVSGWGGGLCLEGGGVVWAADVKLEKFFGFVQFSNLLFGIL
jgi:hypothetical protein